MHESTTAPIDFTADQDGASDSTQSDLGVVAAIGYLAAGTALGIVFMKSEVLSWYRMQEMFRFQSFHMFGILGTAVMTAGLSFLVLRRLEARALSGEKVHVPEREMGRGYRYILGGTVFGMGWALTGACPGPLFVLLGSGASVFVVTILSALFGTWLYAWLRPKLPH